MAEHLIIRIPKPRAVRVYLIFFRYKIFQLVTVHRYTSEVPSKLSFKAKPVRQVRYVVISQKVSVCNAVEQKSSNLFMQMLCCTTSEFMSGLKFAVYLSITAIAPPRETACCPNRSISRYWAATRRVLQYIAPYLYPPYASFQKSYQIPEKRSSDNRRYMFLYRRHSRFQ